MAGKSSMTAEDAAAAIAGVQTYRQGLTARAAGIVWMVWALALAGFASLDFIPMEDTPAEDGVTIVQSSTFGVGVLPLLMLLGAVIVTNAVWRAHALERDTEHRGWVAWVATGGLVVGFFLVGILAVYIAVWTWEPDFTSTETTVTRIFVTPLISAAAAVALTFLQRSRVDWKPGLVAVGALVLVQILVPLLATGTADEKAAQGGTFHILVVMASFIGVGLWHFKRG